MSEFFHMGGYAFFVWTSYGLACVVLTINLISPLQRRRRLLRDIAQKARRTRKMP